MSLQLIAFSVLNISRLSCCGQYRPRMVGPVKDGQLNLPFVPTLTLRPEHYWAATDLSSESSTSFQYPHIPLTYGERKRLSDVLFCLSQEIPTLTKDVSLLPATA